MKNEYLLKCLAAYLPHKINGWGNRHRHILVAVSVERMDGFWTIADDYRFFGVYGQGLIKPVLRPLSNYQDINSDAMNDLNCDVSTQIQINELAIKYIGVSDLHYSTVEICLQKHIDIFGLIDQGLAEPLT